MATMSLATRKSRRASRTEASSFTYLLAALTISMTAEMAVLNWPRSKSEVHLRPMPLSVRKSSAAVPFRALWSTSPASAFWESCQTMFQARLMKRLAPATALGSQSKSFSGGAMNRMARRMVSAP